MIIITDAYYTVPDQKCLLFQIKGKLYKYTCLSNGLASAPRISTKMLKPVLLAVRKKGSKLWYTPVTLF